MAVIEVNACTKCFVQNQGTRSGGSVHALLLDVQRTHSGEGDSFAVEEVNYLFITQRCRKKHNNQDADRI